MRDSRVTERSGASHSSRITRHLSRRGFTLVEMLTVIGIIVLLVSILLPVVSAVRTKGHVADTQAMLARIATGIESYYADFKAYPGPLHNGHIYGGSVNNATLTIQGFADAAKVTMAENLVLGLLGGLKPAPSSTLANPIVMYDASLVGGGALSLNPAAPKKHRAYMDKVNLSDGKYQDENATAADDSPIPEFVDRFPSPMPILYLRAKRGSDGIASNTRTFADQKQYDLNQILGYTSTNIGVGRDLPQSEYRGGATWPQHGLRTWDTNSTTYETSPPQGFGTRYVYPYDFQAYMRHPSIANTPKQKDGYLLISSGADRVYGTKDDQQYPSSR